MKIIGTRLNSKKKRKIKPFVIKSSVKKIFTDPIYNTYKNKVKILIYNPEIKQLIKQVSSKEGHKGLFNVINIISKYNYHIRKNKIIKNTIEKYKDPLNRFTLKVIKNPINVYDVKEKGNTNFQIFELKLKIGKSFKRYFIKEYRNTHPKRLATNELLLLKLMEKEGINIVKPQFAFDSVNLKKYKDNRSFIVSDFTNMYTLEEIIKGKNPKFKIGELSLEKIQDKFREISLAFKKHTNVEIGDIWDHNIFIKKERNSYKLFFFDVFSEESIVNVHDVSKSKGII